MDRSDTLYDYAVKRSTESVQLGGITGLSYRLSPSHAIHLRGLYTNHADDEVRTYQGPDHNRIDAEGNWLRHRSTRLMYVQRDVLSGTVEGKHDFPKAHAAHVEWKFTRSRAARNQPDRREVTYDRWVWDAGNGLEEHWLLGSNGLREFGSLRDDGWGTTLATNLPISFGRFGKGSSPPVTTDRRSSATITIAGSTCIRTRTRTSSRRPSRSSRAASSTARRAAAGGGRRPRSTSTTTAPTSASRPGTCRSTYPSGRR